MNWYRKAQQEESFEEMLGKSLHESEGERRFSKALESLQARAEGKLGEPLDPGDHSAASMIMEHVFSPSTIIDVSLGTISSCLDQAESNLVTAVKLGKMMYIPTDEVVGRYLFGTKRNNAIFNVLRFLMAMGAVKDDKSLNNALYCIDLFNNARPSSMLFDFDPAEVAVDVKKKMARVDNQKRGEE